MQQAAPNRGLTDGHGANLLHTAYLQGKAPASKLLHSKWGGRHPTQVPRTGSQTRPWPASSQEHEEHQNYFEEFRDKVLQIRNVEPNAFENTPERGDVQVNAFENRPKRDDIRKDAFGSTPKRDSIRVNASESTPKRDDTQPNNRKLELVHRLKKQNDKIEELELTVRELKSQQLATSRRHEQEVLNLKAQLKQKERSKPPSSSAKRSSRLLAVHEAEMNGLKHENAALQQRNKEIAKRAKLLASIHRHRMSTLEAKLQSSLSINQHFLSQYEPPTPEEDSTMRLLNDIEDNTTALLLQGGPRLRELGTKSKFRSLILAVIFIARVQKQAHNERAWRIEVME